MHWFLSNCCNSANYLLHSVVICCLKTAYPHNDSKFYLCLMNAATGKWLIITGIIVVLIGLFIYFFHDKLHWLGRLPGDIRIENKNSRFYFPVVTMLIASILLTLIVNIIKRFFH